MHGALARAASASDRTVAQLVRLWVAERLGGECPQVEYRGGETRVERDIPDTSADELLGGPEPMAADAPKAVRLARARALVASVPTRRGFETREIRPGMALEVPTGDSYVEYEGEALRASKRAGDDTGRG